MDNISLGQAFAHVMQSPAYWVWLILAFALMVGMIVKIVKNYQEGEFDGRQVALFSLLAVVIFAFALLFRPCEIAANTTKEQAERGVYIGY